MTVRAATPELISQKVRAVLQKRADAGAIALRAEPRWAGGTIEVNGRQVVVEPCVSPLAVRAALSDWGTDRPDLLVVLCDLADADLGADVLARFTPSRVEGLDPWQAAAGLFGVRTVDAAFRKDDGWVADALLTHVPAEIARPMTGGGVLTVEVAHDALARQLLGADHLHIDAVLRAAAQPDPFRLLDIASPATQAGLLAALAGQGALGSLVAAVIGTGHGDELLALGLVARAVYGDGEHTGGRAAGHLEARCGAAHISPRVGAALAQRSEEVVVTLLSTDRDRANVVIARAATLAGEIGAEHVEDSDLLPDGFERRLAIAAGVLTATLDELDPTAPADLGGLIAAVDLIGAHHQRQTPAGRTRHDHLEMAARLTAWLASPEPDSQPASFEKAATAYASSSAWVDRARRRLWNGDGDLAVGAVYRRVLDVVVARRRLENRRFAERLAAWTATPSGHDTRAASAVVAVEDVASEVLAPLGAGSPVLFVVLDGCGLASFTEIAPQLSETGYREIIGEGGAGRRLTGVAALPTVTEVSRATLIAGRLDRGNQDHERRAFAANTALTIGSKPAAFFHQNRLLGAAGSSLATEVEAALGPDGPAIVGVVVNTIDDHLKRGTFTDELRLVDLHALVALLDVARTHGRTVVISADHGHVLAQPDDGGTGTFQGGGSGGERWRTADRPPAENEVVLKGDRVLLGGEAGVIAPFDDDFRYGAKAGGYHGGATPEEALVPVAVFIPAGIDPPQGWTHATQERPLWWDLELPQSVSPVPAAAGAEQKPRRKAKPVDDSQVPMFDLPPVEPVRVAASAAPGQGAAAAEPPWVAPLLASAVWKLQKGASGRAPLPDDRVRSVLTAVNGRGGVASFAALAADTGLPAARLPGFLALLARVLNVDGYAVLDVDATAAEVRLSLPILAQQFEITVDHR